MQWSQLELELFDTEIPEPIAMPAGQDRPCLVAAEPDALATQIHQRAVYASTRERQGVVHRAAAAPCELTAQSSALRAQSEAGSARAVLTLVALVVGISPTAAPQLPLQPRSDMAVVLDSVRGWVSMDFSRIFLVGAATASCNETGLPARHILLKPLPVFLAEIIRNAYRLTPGAMRLGDLFGDDAPTPHEPLDAHREGRLRATAARMRRALPALALRLGVDRYEAALVTGELSLVPRSRFFYVRSDTERYVAGCRRCFDALGWGEPVPLDVPLPFGSQVVPAYTSVQHVHRQLLQLVAAVHPGRRYSLQGLVEHHNRFMIGAAWFLSFVMGSRAMKRLDVNADRCLPGMAVMEYADKLTGAFQRTQPVLLCRAAQRQVAAVWKHLGHLFTRARKLGLSDSTPWLRHLAATLENRSVPLLFLIRRSAAVPVGTAHLQLGLDRAARLVPNAGRHFWQTVLLNSGISSEALNVWARHASAGIEPMTSTSIGSIDSVRARVCSAQDRVLAELQVGAFVGLGKEDPAVSKNAATRDIVASTRVPCAARHPLVRYRDRSMRTHFGVGRRFGVAHVTVDALVDGLLRQTFLKVHQPGFLLFSLVLDGVVVKDCLELAWQSLAEAYRSADGACVEWLDRDGRLQRRVLGPVTVLALAACKHREPFTAATSQLEAALQTVDFRPDLDALLSALPARLATALPGDLLAHVLHDHPLSAVPRSCLARLTCKQALDVGDANALQDSELDALRLRVTDAVFAAAPDGGPDDASSLLAAICDACRANSAERKSSADRRRMARELAALAPACIAVGGWICLLWSWCADLVDRGTNRTKPLSPHSIAPYVALTLRELYRSICSQPVDTAVDIPWARVYGEIEHAESIAPTQRGKAAAALTSWHEYLVEHLGVAPLDRPIDAEGPSCLPRANIVWPHEQAWIREQLAARANCSRFDAQLATVAELAFSAAMRSQDLWQIHMFGVHEGPDMVALYVDPLPSAGEGKSSNARRVIELSSGQAPIVLRKWIERRRRENALEVDLLFGDPADPNVPFRRGSTEASLNAWLKAATGDRSVSIHTLRHTFVSLARAELSAGDQRAMDEASAQAGHGSTQMSIDHYSHRYEPELRRSIYVWLRNQRLTEREVCGLTGMRSGCLRQRRHRQQQTDARAQAWDAVEAAAALVDLPSVSRGIRMAPARPVPLIGAPALSAAQVLTWLQELRRGVPEEVIKLRNQIGADGWIAFKSAIRSWRHLHQRRASPTGLASSSQSAIPFAPGLDHLAQPKLRPLLLALRSTAHHTLLAPVVESWQDNLRGAYLAADEPHLLRPLLHWLCTCGVTGGQIAVCHDRRCAAEAADVADVIEGVFGAAPVCRPEGRRPGRPDVYLTLRGAGSSSTPTNAAISMQGLHVLLFAAWVWLQMLAAGAHGDD